MENEFELEKREVTVQELDEAVINYKRAKEEYDKASAVSSEKHEEAEKLKLKVLDLLTASGKNSFIVDGVATVTVTQKSQVTTPKTIEQKEKLFNWIENKLGKEGLLAYQSINYNTLNSLYNSMMEETLKKNEEWNGIDGIELPTVVRTLSIRAR